MVSRREQLARQICETGGVGRYLLPGRNLELASHLYDAEADLREFLSQLEAGGGGVDLLASAYWLSQPEVEHFILEVVPALLRRLGHASRATAPRIEPRPGSHVLWASTALGWVSGTVPRASYVVAPIERSADLPENRLLKLFLCRVLEIAGDLAATGAGAMPARFLALHRAAEIGLANAYLQSVQLERKFTSFMRSAARARRDRDYGELVEQVERYEAAVSEGKWTQLLEMMSRGWLAPVTTEDLFELYGLILILDIIEKDLGLGSPVSYGLIQRGRKEVATFCNADSFLRVNVYFDQVPSKIFGRTSRYVSLASRHHGFEAAERRPDLFIEICVGDQLCRVLVEFKESDNSNYMRDSLYKVFGYLLDFAEVWDDAAINGPRALLMFPSGVGPDFIGEMPRDVVMVSADEREVLVNVLRQVTGLQMPNGAKEASKSMFELCAIG